MTLIVNTFFTNMFVIKVITSIFEQFIGVIMAKKTYKGKNKFGVSKWLFDWTDYFTGKRHRKTYTMTEQEAESKRQKLESLEMCRDTGIPVDINNPNSVSVEFVFDAYLNDYIKLCNAKKRSIKSFNRHKHALKLFLEVFPKHTLVNSLTVSVVDGNVYNPMQKFNDHFKHHSNSGININLQSIIAVFNWAKRNNIIVSTPTAVKEVEEKKKVHILTDQEIQSILQAEVNSEMKDVFILYLNTGARKIELLKDNFTWDDIDWERKEITLLRKNNERHTIIVNDMVLNILAKYKDRSHPISWSASWIDSCIVELRKKSGVYFTCHDIRRSAGALLVRSGVRLAKVSKWMNHKDIKITYDHYYDIIDTERESIANKLEENCLNMMVSNNEMPNIMAN